MQVRISELIAQPHLQEFNSNSLEQILKGGRASFKSSRNALKIALKTLEEPCEVIVVRENYTNHKDTTFADLKWAYDKLGVKLQAKTHYPNGNDLYISLPNGSYIHFAHMKDIDSLKGTRPRNPKLTIKIMWFYEITEMKSKWHIENAISLMRGVKGWAWILYEYNPAPKLSHWTYQWFDDMQGTDNVLAYHTNYCDAPIEQQEDFLGRIYLDRIEKLKKIDFEQYKSIYHGMPANLSGTVYKNFDINRHIKEPTHDYMDVTIGIDVGGADATVFSAEGWLKGYKGLEIFDGYYHKNGYSEGIKTINNYCDDLMTFAKEIYRWYKRPITLYIDPAELTFKQLVQERTYTEDYSFLFIEEFTKRSSDLNKSSVQERVDITEIMFGAGFLTIAPHLKQHIKAFIEAEYDKNNERADNGTSDIDSLDSFEYGWLKDKKMILDIILG